MQLKDRKEAIFIDVLNKLDKHGKKLKPTVKGYVFMAIMAVEMVLIFGYGRTKEEIMIMRQQIF